MVPSGQRPHPAGSPLPAQAPNSHAHMLGLSVHLLLPEPWPAWEVETDDRGSHTHTANCSGPCGLPPPPPAGEPSGLGSSSGSQWKEEGVGGRSPG